MHFYDLENYSEEQLNELINVCLTKLNKLQKNESNKYTYEILLNMYERLTELKKIKFNNSFLLDSDSNENEEEEDSHVVIETDIELREYDKFLEQEKKLLIEKLRKNKE